MRDLARGDVLPASWTDGIQEYIATVATNLRLVRSGTTSVQVPAGAGDDQVAVGIDGLWRYRTSAVTSAHPGGAAGTYDVLLVASANVFADVPDPDTDTTDYTFGLQVVVSGGVAAGTYGGRAITGQRKVGEVVWDGSKITRVRQLVGKQRDTSPVIGGSPAADMEAGVFTAFAGQTGDIVTVESSTGTRYANFDSTGHFVVQTAGGSATIALTSTGANTGITIGGDTNLYRSSANVLKTDDALVVGGSSLTVGGNVTVLAGAGYISQQTATNTVSGNYLLAGDAQYAFRVRGDGQLLWGPGGSTALDTNLYRLAADVLKTDDNLRAAGGFMADTATANHAFRGTQPAGNTLVSNYLLSGDAQPAFQILGSGIHNWGAGGASAPDTNLYRSSADHLTTDDTFTAPSFAVSGGTGQVAARSSTAANNISWASRISTDTQDRFQLLADGTHNWGAGGASAPDTSLVRGGANSLTASGSLAVGGNVSLTATGAFIQRNATATGTVVFTTRIAADTQDRFFIQADGGLAWGPGGASASDVNLYRSAANVLKTDDDLAVVGSIRADISGAGAQLLFGSAGDTNLYRSAVNTLKTDDSLVVAGSNFQHNGTNVGFYGVAAVTRQTRPTTMNGLVTAVANVGLTT